MYLREGTLCNRFSNIRFFYYLAEDAGRVSAVVLLVSLLGLIEGRELVLQLVVLAAISVIPLGLPCLGVPSILSFWLSYD